jgi:hypothetical protein
MPVPLMFSIRAAPHSELQRRTCNATGRENLGARCTKVTEVVLVVKFVLWGRRTIGGERCRGQWPTSGMGRHPPWVVCTNTALVGDDDWAGDY